jgi:phospholipase C
MAGILDQVTSIILVMMENRSFDHILGHLTVDDPGLDINGLRAPLDQYSNVYNGTPYPPFPRDNDNEMAHDVPHESDFVATQLAYNAINDKFNMDGFVKAYADSTGIPPNVQCDPMGYFPPQFLPMTNFLASGFCLCDSWFAPIPTSTQPNRQMAFSGDSSVFQTKTQLKGLDNDIFHWMDNHQVRWRVYHDGFSFFSLYPNLWPFVLGEQFRRYESLYADCQNEPLSSAPQVTVIEPSYEDAPHLGSKHPNDNHAPLAVSWGEDFLRRTYHAITSNPEKWKGTLMVIYYDEHGGFYDHEPPRKIPYTTTGDEKHSFTSTGPRIPAILVSPLIKPGTHCHELFDHTSVLQLLAEKFGKPGEGYSPNVDARRSAGISSLTKALNNPQPFDAPPAPAVGIPAVTVLGRNLSTPPQSAMGQAFETAGLQLLAQKPAEIAVKYPELVQWKDQAAMSTAGQAAMSTANQAAKTQ